MTALNYKKLIALTAVGALSAQLALAPLNVLAAQPAAQSSLQSQQGAIQAAQIPAQLEGNIKEAIAAVYGEKQVAPIYKNVMKILAEGQATRGQALKQQDLDRASDWYKDEIVYMLYADRYGLKAGEKTATFKDTAGMLNYLQNLGVTTIYILPFMDSPMGDAGFDVRDFTKVRDDLGGNPEFQQFIMAARDKGFKIKSDLILNHISDQHAWFQAALKGDKSKMDYFIHTSKLPDFKKYTDPQRGVVVDYTEKDGKISSRRLIFPDIAKNHYREVTVNGKPEYFYHTFYPFQLDVNWENPEVLYEVLRIMNYWANLGIDIFRVDAIPFFVKEPGTDGENRPQTYALVSLLSSYLQSLAPRSVIMVEACQWHKDIMPYFGHAETYIEDINGKPKTVTRTDKSQIAYNFPYMPAIWASLITQDNEHFWKAYKETPALPESASWAVFLRVHDELTLEMVDPETRKIVYNALEPKGAKFREGLGVSGRMANFLDKDPNRIALAFSILMSLPGVPIIYYGDEVGEGNDFDFAKQYAAQREATQKIQNPGKNDVISFWDSRDINRGLMTQSELYKTLEEAKTGANTYNSEIFTAVQHLITVRKANPIMRRGQLTPLESDKSSVFSYLRSNAQDNVLVVNNLKNEPTEVTLTLPATLNSDPDKPMTDLLGNKGPVSATRDGQKLTLTLAPYQSLWLQI